MKQYNAREFIKLLTDNGFEYFRTNGSHRIYQRGYDNVPVPLKLNHMIAKRIIKQYELEV